MIRTTTVFGLLAIAVTIVAAIVLFSGSLIDTPAVPAPDTSLSFMSWSFMSCSSCDARHQRLKKGLLGKD